MEDEERDAPTIISKRGKNVALWVFSMSIVTMLLLVVGIGALAHRTQRIAPLVGNSEWLAHSTRAEGDLYLLGVGKADITGYVEWIH